MGSYTNYQLGLRYIFFKWAALKKTPNQIKILREKKKKIQHEVFSRDKTWNN